MCLLVHFTLPTIFIVDIKLAKKSISSLQLFYYRELIRKIQLGGRRDRELPQGEVAGDYSDCLNADKSAVGVYGNLSPYYDGYGVMDPFAFKLGKHKIFLYLDAGNVLRSTVESPGKDEGLLIYFQNLGIFLPDTSYYIDLEIQVVWDEVEKIEVLCKLHESEKKN